MSRATVARRMSRATGARRMSPITVALAIVVLALPVHTGAASATEIDRATGLPIAAGFEQVRLHCSGCHSARLVAQNRATREGWLDLIRWMQRTQRLGPLGEDEPAILDYLATWLGPTRDRRARRAPLPPALRPPH